MSGTSNIAPNDYVTVDLEISEFEPKLATPKEDADKTLDFEEGIKTLRASGLDTNTYISVAEELEQQAAKEPNQSFKCEKYAELIEARDNIKDTIVPSIEKDQMSTAYSAINVLLKIEQGDDHCKIEAPKL
jgi:hypothetical protein